MKDLSRRNFLNRSALAAGSFGLSSVIGADSLRAMGAPPLQDIQYTDFESIIGQEFKLSTDGLFSKYAVLENIQLSQQLEPIMDPVVTRQTSFSVKWKIKTNEEVKDGIYTLHHPEFGRMNLFFCGISKSSHGMIMETMFS